MNGILLTLVSSLCDVCSAVSRSISWARCLPVVAVSMFKFLFLDLGSDSFSSFCLYYLRTVIRFMEVVTVQQNVRSSLELNGY